MDELKNFNKESFDQGKLLDLDFRSFEAPKKHALLSSSVDTALLEACGYSANPSNPSLKAIKEHIAAGGNRVRARICLDAGLRLGLKDEEALLGATVCELLHNASLVQDDLLDRSPLRRDAPSVWAKYGESTAVCAGDLMLSAAYGLLSKISRSDLIAPALQLTHKRTREVILGQASERIRDAALESTEVYYERLAQGKSASLLSLALELPLLLSENAEHIPTAYSVACDFAVAYQIVDDLADFTEDQSQDQKEGPSNILNLLILDKGLAQHEAFLCAGQIAIAKINSARSHTKNLPNECATLLLQHSEKLLQALARNHSGSPKKVGIH